MRPTNHTVIITTPAVTVRGRVISVKRMGAGVATLVVETVDVLPFGTYEATYTTPSQEAAGIFQVFKYGAGKNYRWWASGWFESEKKKPWEKG